MAIGLKMRDVRRFGQKVQKGVRNIARKISSGAGTVADVVSPLATMINPELGMGVEVLARGVQKGAKQVERLTDKGVAAGGKGFKTLQQPVLGVRELGGVAQKIAAKPMEYLKEPEKAKIMIGDAVAARMKPRKKGGIQRAGEDEANEWDVLPFAGGM